MQRTWWVRLSLQRDCGCARGGARKPACRRASSMMARSLLRCMSGPHTKPQGITKTLASIPSMWEHLVKTLGRRSAKTFLLCRFA